MRPRRPTSVLVVAVFHFVLGGLGVLAALVTIGATAFVYSLLRSPGPATGRPAFSPVAQYQYLDAHLPYWKETDVAFGVLYLIISVLMIVAGVGLVRMKPWGRGLSLLYGAASMVAQVIRLTYVFAFFLPAMMAFYDTVAFGPAGGAPPAAAAGLKVGLVVGSGVALVGLVYPIIVLIVMLLPSVAAAFRGEAAAPDDHYDRGPREDDYGRYPPGYGREPDDRFGPAPQ